MDISNLSREQKKEKILEDHSKKKNNNFKYSFPKEKLEDKEILDILDKIIDEIGYITDLRKYYD